MTRREINNDSNNGSSMQGGWERDEKSELSPYFSQTYFWQVKKRKR